MIDDRVFLITVSAVDSQNAAQPSVYESSSKSSLKLIMNPDVYYFDYPQQNYAFNTITALNLNEIGAAPGKVESTDSNVINGLVSKTFMIGAGSTVYVSDKAIYIAYPENPWPTPVVRQGQMADLVASTSTQST
jgi:hypothetical protein